MTELQIAIGHLNETISVGNVLLTKLEKQQKEAEKLKVPIFPWRFTIIKDAHIKGDFLIGLQEDNIYPYAELPKDFKGRAGFNRTDLRQIIAGIQTLLGEPNG